MTICHKNNIGIEIAIYTMKMIINKANISYL